MTRTIEYLDFAPVQTLADLETAFRDVAARFAGLDSPRGRADLDARTMEATIYAGLDSPRGRVDLDARTIEATIYDGCYGPAGIILAVNGSPARGTFLIPSEALEDNDWAIIVYLGVAQRTKTLSGYRNGTDYRIVVAYAKALWTAQTRRSA